MGDQLDGILDRNGLHRRILLRCGATIVGQCDAVHFRGGIRTQVLFGRPAPHPDSEQLASLLGAFLRSAELPKPLSMMSPRAPPGWHASVLGRWPRPQPG